MYRIAIVLFITFCSSCVHTMRNGTIPPEAQKDRSVVFINDSPRNTPIASGYIIRADGKVYATDWTWSGAPNEVALSPGKHSISVSFYSVGVAGEATVQGVLLPGHVYEIKAISNCTKTFRVTLEDVSVNPKKILNDIIIKGHYSA